MNNKLLNLLNFLAILLSLLVISGSLVYRFYSLNNLGVIISLILAVISFIIIAYFYLNFNKKTSNRETAIVNKNNTSGPWLLKFFSAGIYFFLLLISFYILLNHRSQASLVSPWQVVPEYFFIIYALVTLFLFINAIINKKITLFLIICYYFLSFSVALIIYKIGYGYDPFVHQATESLINKTGSVLPKPLYYLGQYSLIVIIHKITALPLLWLDKLAVPFLAALFLPITLWRVLKNWFTSDSLNLILIISVLALSFPFLIVTTPQNFAYLLLILVILLGLSCKNLFDYLTIFLLSLAAVAIHLLAGLPALLFSAGLAIFHSDNLKYKKYFYPLLGLTAASVLPALFYFLNRKLTPAIASALPAQNYDFLKLNLPGQENFILNFIYLYAYNFKFIIAALVFSGIIISWKYRRQCKILFIYLLMSLALFIAYLITSKIAFNFLINYERDDYPQRILLMSGFFLLPFIIISIYAMLEKISKQNYFSIISFSLFAAALICSALYITYPRYDNYFNSRGYSVSGADIKAVAWINSDATDDYIVLANQQVSVAALSQYNFKKYYPAENKNQELIFYYPIPTSSPLYSYYLDMVYKKPNRETMFKAMALTKVNQAYFVLNKYWWAFPKILAEAKLAADSWQEIGNGEVYIFKYIKN